MTGVFDAYARYYDLLYCDKDYAKESEYVASFIRKHNPTAKRILELGCGTGGHAVHLAAMGYLVHGVDLSNDMLNRAKLRKDTLPKEIASRLSFELGDVRTIRSGETFDAVISLFHVMSYQITNDDLSQAFQTAFEHLSPGGTFLFDFWHGPAVLSEKPEIRVKRLEDEQIDVTRIAEPVLEINGSTVDVNYTLFIKDKVKGGIECITEAHKLRYLFLSELDHFLAGRFVSPSISEWMTDKPLSVSTWSAFLCANRA